MYTRVNPVLERVFLRSNLICTDLAASTSSSPAFTICSQMSNGLVHISGSRVLFRFKLHHAQSEFLTNQTAWPSREQETMCFYTKCPSSGVCHQRWRVLRLAAYHMKLMKSVISQYPELVDRWSAKGKRSQKMSQKVYKRSCF
jgi:hypothetical protein